MLCDVVPVVEEPMGHLVSTALTMGKNRRVLLQDQKTVPAVMTVVTMCTVSSGTSHKSWRDIGRYMIWTSWGICIHTHSQYNRRTKIHMWQTWLKRICVEKLKDAHVRMGCHIRNKSHVRSLPKPPYPKRCWCHHYWYMLTRAGIQLFLIFQGINYMSTCLKEKSVVEVRGRVCRHNMLFQPII